MRCVIIKPWMSVESAGSKQHNQREGQLGNREAFGGTGSSAGRIAGGHELMFGQDHWFGISDRNGWGSAGYEHNDSNHVEQNWLQWWSPCECPTMFTSYACRAVKARSE
jgi:hypothetical protein